MAFLREIKTKRKSGKIYSYWVMIKTFWDKKERKVRHKLVQNLGQLSINEVERIKTILSLKKIKPDSFITDWEQIKTKKTYSYLLPVVLDKIWQLWGLNKLFKEGEISLVPMSIMTEILVLNRAICPNSDYQVGNWYKRTILAKLLKISSDLINPTKIYRTLDQILPLEKEIQMHIGKKVKELGFSDLRLIFYDITSSYFEGNSCELSEFGLSRDYRKDKEQLLLALCVTKEGFPIYWKVLSGGLHDSKTVKETINILKDDFKVKDTIVVMDKGMVNNENLDFLESNEFNYIITTSKQRIRNLDDFPSKLLKEIGEEIEKGNKEGVEDFSKIMGRYSYFRYYSKRAYYHELKQEWGKRYILCFNPEKYLEERKQREEKIKSIEKYIAKLNEELSKSKYSRDKDKLMKEVYAYLKKREEENLFNIELIRMKKKIKKREITTYQIKINTREEKLERLKICDGVYCISTNLSKEEAPEFLVSSYRQRRKVEVAFAYLKGFIEIRPFYHHKEERVKAHILICILAYLLQITIEYLLKKKDINITFQEVRQRFERSDAVEVEVKNIKREMLKITTMSQEDINILEALEMKEIIQEDFIEKTI